MGFEFQILDFLQKLHTPVLDMIMCFFTLLGSKGIIWFLLGVVLLFFRKTRRTGIILLVAFVLDVIICSGILKHLVARVRPCDIRTDVPMLLARPTGYSFPSGHTAVAFASVAALYFSGVKKWWKPALVVALLIAFSRLYLYAHFPTDVLGGIVFGSMCGMLAVLIVNKVNRWRRARSRKAARAGRAGDM